MVTRLCLALLTFAAVAQATSFTCAPPPGAPLCQFPRKIDVAFIGTAIATNENPDDHQNPDFANTWYQFKIEEPLSGLRPNETSIRVYLGLGGGTAIIGRPFFVHAERAGNGFRFATCGNTRPAEEAETDIAYLRARLRGDFHPYLAGSILRHYKASPFALEAWPTDHSRGVPHATVTLTGPAGAITLRTDANGAYRRENVPPGKYTVSLQAPGYAFQKAHAIEVPPNGCGLGHFGAFTNAGIFGNVKRPDGTPAANLELELIDSDPHFPAITGYLDRPTTGPNGEFAITNLPSGSFLLGVNIHHSTRYPDQTPPTYYPGVAARSAATKIELKPNERKQNLVLTLLPPRPFRTVRVNLRLPDGSVPRGGAIDAYVNEGIYVSNYQLTNGRFELKLLQGVDYWLTAAANVPARHPTRFANHEWRYADNFRLPAGNDDIEITLTGVHHDPQWSKALYPNLHPK